MPGKRTARTAMSSQRPILSEIIGAAEDASNVDAHISVSGNAARRRSSLSDISRGRNAEEVWRVENRANAELVSLYAKIWPEHVDTR